MALIVLLHEGGEGNNFLKIQLFLIITFALSWGMTWIYFGLGGRVSQPLFYVISVTVMFTPFLATLNVRSRTGSVVAAAMMHGSLNGVGMAPAAILTGGDSLTTGILGIPGIGVLVVLNVSLYFFIGKKSVSA